jgi:hypothetical protein
MHSPLLFPQVILLPVGAIALFATAMVTFSDTVKMQGRLNGTGHFHISENQTRSLAWFMVAVVCLEVCTSLLYLSSVSS